MVRNTPDLLPAGRRSGGVKQNRHSDYNKQIDNEIATRITHDAAYAVSIVVNAVVKPGIEPAKEAAFFS